MSIIKEFSQMPEHQEAQCCVICLMSHGEEGYLTTKEGDKVCFLFAYQITILTVTHIYDRYYWTKYLHCLII